VNGNVKVNLELDLSNF